MDALTRPGGLCPVGKTKDVPRAPWILKKKKKKSTLSPAKHHHSTSTRQWETIRVETMRSPFPRLTKTPWVDPEVFGPIRPE